MDTDHPTDETLERIRTWHIRDPGGCLDFVLKHWNTGYGSASHELRECERELVHGDGVRFLRLATGGWSGNEDLFRALMENTTIWAQTWEMSKRGGLHIFRHP
jgi:hypothetical protein